jgi:hypothetical protein
MVTMNQRSPDSSGDPNRAAQISSYTLLKRDLHLDAHEPISERFQHPKLAETFRHIAYVTTLSMKTIYCWYASFRHNVDWHLGQAHGLPNRRAFRGGERDRRARNKSLPFTSPPRETRNPSQSGPSQISRVLTGLGDDYSSSENRLQVHATLTHQLHEAKPAVIPMHSGSTSSGH